MHCPKCGQDVKVRHGYCTECGEAVQASTPSGTTQKGKTAFDPGVQQGPVATAKGSTVFDPGVQQGPTSTRKGSTAFDPGVQQGPVATAKGSTVFDPGVQQGPTSTRKGSTAFDPGVQTRPHTTSRKATTFDPGVQSAPAAQSGATMLGQTAFDSSQVRTDEFSVTHQDPGRRLVGWLVTFSHRTYGEDYRLCEGRNVIGADTAEASVAILNDHHISAKHAVIMFREGQFLIRDADSSNGTFVNARDIFGEGSVVLKCGDSIRCGSTDFKIITID